jgi:hypothetical protein
LAAFGAGGRALKPEDDEPLLNLARQADISSGADRMSLLAELKKASSAKRANWILNLGNPMDAQLSFIGRALPPGDRAARVAALAQHEKDYSSDFKVGDAHPELLDSIRLFANRWARGNLSKPNTHLVSAFPTRSSCIERSAAKGGNLAYWRDAYDDAFMGYGFGV